MEVTTSQQFREAGEQAKDILRLQGNSLDFKGKRSLELDVLRASNLRKVEEVTGLKFDVFEKADPHIGAFITVADQKTFMAAHSLDDLEWALFAGKHELKHKQTKDFMQVGNSKITVFSDQYDVLDQELQDMGIDMKSINWIEGFTDLLTAREIGKKSTSGYADHEVPAAEKLDALCLEKTGASLAEAFNANNVPLFTSMLRGLCESLMMEKAYDHLAGQDPEIESMRPQVKEKMKNYRPIVQSREEAEKAVSKMIAECVALQQIRRYVGLDENLSSVPAPAGMLS